MWYDLFIFVVQRVLLMFSSYCRINHSLLSFSSHWQRCVWRLKQWELHQDLLYTTHWLMHTELWVDKAALAYQQDSVQNLLCKKICSTHCSGENVYIVSWTWLFISQNKCEMLSHQFLAINMCSDWTAGWDESQKSRVPDFRIDIQWQIVLWALRGPVAILSWRTSFITSSRL